MMDRALEAFTEAVPVPGSISGIEVISDLCGRIAKKLSTSCDLRAVDSYVRYAATVEIKLQLIDVDATEVAAEVVVGTIDPRQSSEHITVTVPTVVSEEGRKISPFESALPERPVTGPVLETPKRFYAPRNRPHR
jgi:hypothetical protein